ncbi:unnamed protein product [Phyllotreta striolata]|uniref:Rho-GAP domain-containing protein n=1 Tax=Phyllotreta striolata TaxID=444603 RepID=A0A9N9XLI3_PHYSR|nr:unnamed protein product [Phyllotreta striolata]
MCSNNDETDLTIVERFKRDYTEQFYILVRMHLSFLLDVNTDDNDSLPEKRIKKWNLIPFAKKSRLRSTLEGSQLTQDTINQIFQLIGFLKDEENIKSEGIFRRTGSIERQQELRSFLNQGSTLCLDNGNYSVHDCASVLKGFIQDLADPLLTEVHFPVYCQIAELYDLNQPSTEPALRESKLLEALQLLMLLLPSENKLLFKELMELLHRTASYEPQNRMSPENLAKLFTPHLLCPRSLTPTLLLKVSKPLFSIVGFMINNHSKLFEIPAKLIVEFHAKYERKRCFNESSADVASTVFTFVDRERTAKENEANPTETALAELYAHIQSLPESSKKRKLVKQFNKENGHGTPQALKNSKNRSIGDSIKKRIFQRHLAGKKRYIMKGSASCDSACESPVGSPLRARLFCLHDGDSPESIKRRKTSRSCEALVLERPEEDGEGKESFSEPECLPNRNVYLTSTPACFPSKACDDVFTPVSKDRASMSPITMSAQRMSRAMQETMMTPRSRKPVLLLSGTNINALPAEPAQMEPNRARVEVDKSDNESEAGLSNTFKEYLSSRRMVALRDSSFSSRTDDFDSTDLGDGELSDSLMYCLDGNDPDGLGVIEEERRGDEKELVLKPKQFDENGKPVIFETSF